MYWALINITGPIGSLASSLYNSVWRETLRRGTILFQVQPSIGKSIPNTATTGFEEYFERLNNIDFFTIIASFIFYFIGGFILYGSLFAAIGSAVDNEADTQQFMLPVTIPLIFSIVLGLSFVLNNPDGHVAWWLSIIPFTSPIIMMIRIPFGVNIYSELLPSVVLLIIGFLATTWIAARIYRTGILMYGKKANYKELWKWLTFKY